MPFPKTHAAPYNHDQVEHLCCLLPSLSDLLVPNSSSILRPLKTFPGGSLIRSGRRGLTAAAVAYLGVAS